MMPPNHFKIISDLVSLSMATAKIKKLTLHEPKRDICIRPQLHVILQSRFGSCKSTILSEIAKSYEPALNIYTNLTMPSLTGTIDSQTKQIIPPVSWDARNSTLLLDEFKYKEKSDLIDALLMILENQAYGRRFGLFSMSSNKKDGDLYFRVKRGEIMMKTRFNMILATMRALNRTRDIPLQALVSRGVLYHFTLTRKELNKIARGEKILSITLHDVKEEIEINKHVYMKIVRFVDKSGVSDSHYLRCINDCCRSYAVLNDFKMMKLITTLHKNFCRIGEKA